MTSDEADTILGPEVTAQVDVAVPLPAEKVKQLADLLTHAAAKPEPLPETA